MDKLVGRDIKEDKIYTFVQKSTPKKKKLDLNFG